MSRPDTIAVVEEHRLDDPWQERLDRLRRVAPLPLLALSTAAAFASPHYPGRPLATVGTALVVAAALLWTAGIVRPWTGAPAGWRYGLFAAHTGIVAVLVWIDPAFGIFGYTGFLYSYGLGPRVRIAGFVVTALIVSASITGYPEHPSADPGQTVGFVLVALVFVALVTTSSSITARAVDQSRERGRMIAELAEANRRLAASTAENAGLQARLLDQARETGVAAERQRLAGEIHDTLAQDLTGIVTQLEAAQQHGEPTPEWARHVESARSLARTALTEARRSVRALTPAALERDGLVAALGELAASSGRRSGVDTSFDLSGDPGGLPSAMETALFRVAQEATTNVGRHAGAARARITLTRTGSDVLLDVVDDGAGFDPSAAPAGYGLASMRERMAAVGGTLTVESAPGAGTSVNATVRVPA